jgi:DNA helicase-2/ATP-dependent DNA helicase PcrA
MDVSHILENLNDPQREAVTSEDKSLLVLAGAGSGKTRVLVHRIAWNVEAMGLNPSSIMAVTLPIKQLKRCNQEFKSCCNLLQEICGVEPFMV